MEKTYLNKGFPINPFLSHPEREVPHVIHFIGRICWSAKCYPAQPAAVDMTTDVSTCFERSLNRRGTTNGTCPLPGAKTEKTIKNEEKYVFLSFS